VDWVALASLRDSTNLFSDYQSHTNAAAGITLPGTLAGWFSASGFSQVENRTNLVFDSDLRLGSFSSRPGSAACRDPPPRSARTSRRKSCDAAVASRPESERLLVRDCKKASFEQHHDKR
jgi:hypothetical protein